MIPKTAIIQGDCMDKLRYYFECENGRRWSEVTEFEMLQSKDGDTCNFSGCLRDHKIKLVKTIENLIGSSKGHTWFKGYDKWEDTPVWKSLGFDLSSLLS